MIYDVSRRQVPKELEVLFQEDRELAMALAQSKVSSFGEVYRLEDSAIEKLPISGAQKEVVRSLKRADMRDCYLPGDVIVVCSLAGKNLDLLLNQLQARDVPDIKRKLEKGGVTVDNLRSASLTGEDLKAWCLPLGLRKGILSWRDKEYTPWKVVSLKGSGIFELVSDSFGKREAHFSLMSLVEVGPLSAALSEMGFHDREAISVALQTLRLGSFNSGLDSPDGQKILDLLIGGSLDNLQEVQGEDEEEEAGEVEKQASNSSSVTGGTSCQAKIIAQEQVNNYAAVLAILRCLRLKKPFPPFFVVEIRRSLRSMSPITKGEGLDEIMTDRYLLSEEDIFLGTDNTIWSMELDSIMVLLLTEGYSYFFYFT